MKAANDQEPTTNRIEENLILKNWPAIKQERKKIKNDDIFENRYFIRFHFILTYVL